jgi:hypothetical protein
MAVFPDRIVLKNSTDSQAAIVSAIVSGGTDAIVPGELVIGRNNGSVTLYTVDADGDIVLFTGSTGAPSVGSNIFTSFVRETRTASGGAITFTGIGQSGQFVEVSSSLDAWIVFYPSAASRTADAGRPYGTSPGVNSGVLAEFYITAGSTVLVSPGTTYFNNDTIKASAIYAAVRSQAGANVDSEVTVECYAAAGIVGARKTATVTTSSIADNAAENATFAEVGKSGSFISVTTDRAAWVVFYESTAARSADLVRPIGIDPSPGSGVLAEVITLTAETIKLTPVAGYFNNESTVAPELYAKIVNKSGATSSVKVDIVVMPTES